MEDYPSNSHKKKTPPKAIEETKKVERVVEGEVIRRKKPLGKRFAELFIGGDAKSVGSYVMFEVLLPAVKDTLADAMSQGVERMLFGEARSTSRRTGRRPGGSYYDNTYISYNRPPNRATGAPGSYGRMEEPRHMSRRNRANHDFDEIILATRVEAEEVIDNLFGLVSQYESASVADLYELVGVTGSFADEKWGWTDLRGAGVSRIRNGYLLDLPKPEPLD